MRRVTAVTVLCGSLVVGASAHADSLARLALSETATPLLGGHVAAQFPATATQEARGHSIMAAANPVEEETRIVINDGDKRVVVMTYELFATVDKSFEKAVRKEVKQFFSSGAAYTVAPKKIGDFARAFVMKPDKLDGTQGANLVLGAYLAHPDGTAQFVAFYANPEAALTDAAGCTKLAGQILATYRSGGAQLSLTGGAQTLFAWQHELHIDVPAGWVVTTTMGPDFVVHRGRQLTPFGAPSASLGLYLGGHPNAQYDQLGEQTRPTQTSGKLAGAAVVWHSWTDTTGLMRKEALATKVAPGDQALALHVFMAGPAAADIAMMDAIAATLRLTKKP